MKLLGIIGGLGPQSTVDYYHSIIAAYQTQKPDGSYPPMVINSVDLKKVADGITAGELAAVTDYLLQELQRLARAGADFALISANTPHLVFDDLRQRFPLPLLSIVEATCEEAQSRGFRRLALFGTRFTMEGRFYPEVFSRRGIDLVIPSPAERAYLHEKYMGELVKGVFLPETREGFVAIARRLRNEEKIEALILGGTELPLILREVPGISSLDTTQIHVRAAAKEILS